MRLIYLEVAICAFFISSASQGATILTENFDALTPALDVTSAGVFTAVGGTNIDIVGPSNGFGALCAAPESGNCLDMDGSGGLSQGDIQSALITLMPGTTYFLSFDLIGSGRGPMASTTVNFGPYTQTFNLATGDVSTGIVVNQPVTVSVPTPTVLEFVSNTPGNIGDVLDNVSITTSAVSAVPEPAGTSAILGSALLAAGALLRRRGQK